MFLENPALRQKGAKRKFSLREIVLVMIFPFKLEDVPRRCFGDGLM